jgi:hypothetical protein
MKKGHRRRILRKIYPVRGGNLFEDEYAKEMEGLGWGVVFDKFLDRFRKVDRRLVGFRGSELRATIDIQVSLNGSFEKLDEYIRYQRKHPNGHIKVFLLADNLATPHEAAWHSSELFRRHILRDARPYVGKAWMVEVEHEKGACWVDILKRHKALRERRDEQRNSSKRLRGTIDIVTKDRRGAVIKNCRSRYFAYITDIDDRRFFTRFERGEVKPGTPVTFYPTTETSAGPYYLARCVLPA